MKNNHTLLFAFLIVFSSCRKTQIKPPSSPMDLKASSVSKGKVLLEWMDNSTDEDGFQIERGYGTGTFLILARTDRDLSRFVDSGLAPSTSYIYRVTAFNRAGTSTLYSNEATVTTWGPPTLSTGSVSDSTPGSAVAGGLIVSDGGSPVTKRGVVWSTSPAPLASLPTRTSDGIGTGTFTSRLTGLSPATKYHVRAYAVNSTDTSYGQEVTFTTPQVDVYVTGSGWDGGSVTDAIVWKNGARIVLPTENGGEADGIWVEGRDVYVAGYDMNASLKKHTATLWKNGTPISLDDQYPGITHSGATDVTVSGKDVYVCGYLYNKTKSRYTAVMWKNGVKTLLTDTLHSSYAEALEISGNDIYIAGWRKIGSHHKAHYWMNGSAVALTGGITLSEGFDIAISGADVLVAGWECADPTDGVTKLIAKVWRNGIPTTLSDGAKQTKAMSVFVENKDVHAVGHLYNGLTFHPRAWKNGSPSDIPLFNGSMDVKYALLKDVQVAFGVLYMAGESSLTGSMNAAVWKNGVESHLPNGGRNVKVNALWVTR